MRAKGLMRGARGVLLAALLALGTADVVGGLYGCPIGAPKTTTATAPADIAALNRVMAEKALTVMADAFRLSSKVRVLVRNSGAPADKVAAFERGYVAFQAKADAAIERVRAESRATDPVLRRVGDAVSPLLPLLRDLDALLRGTVPSGHASVEVMDGALALLQAVVAFGQPGTGGGTGQ